MPDVVGQVTTRNKDQDFVIIEPGKTFEFAKIKASGHISYFWMTASLGKMGPFGRISTILKRYGLRNYIFYDRPDFLKKVLLRIYFDDHIEPDVDVSIADFFGMGFGRYKQFDSKYIGMTSGGFYSNFEMPFGKSCKIEILNMNSDSITFFADITYKKQEELFGLAYFRTTYSENALTNSQPYTILDQTGSGYYLGCNLYMKGKNILKGLSFLEGDLRVFVDEEKNPSLNYTGTEDYFLGGWYFIKGEFAVDDHGCTYKSWLERKVSAYRFHPDKVNFTKNIKIEIDHGEKNEVDGVYSSVAYWYQLEP